MLVLACLSLPSCAGTVGDTQVHVLLDTDLPVPLVIGRLRVDVFSETGTWMDTRDVRLPTVADWPASFDVYAPAGRAPRRVRIRARAYAEGALRDYRGERFEPPPSTDAAPGDVAPAAAPAEGPRLLRGDRDETPSTEPSPNLTVDRLAWLTPAAGDHRTVRLVLGGECAGAMADLASDTTCVDGRRVSTPEATEGGETERSVAGTFGVEEPTTSPPGAATVLADGTSLYDDEVLVEGGAFILGTRALVESTGTAEGAGNVRPSPEHIVTVPSFFVDRYEVTVARWRAALARGYRPIFDALVNNDGPIVYDQANPTRLCTYSTTPRKDGSRETFPLTCIFASDAQAFCTYENKTLLSEARWEFLASAWGRTHKSLQPTELPPKNCEIAALGREPNGECRSLGYGPVAVDAYPDDVTRGPGGASVFGLTGNAAEIVLDDFRPYESVCWARAGVRDPRCSDPLSQYGTARGGGFDTLLGSLVSTARLPIARNFVSPGLGFRCSREAH